MKVCSRGAEFISDRFICLPAFRLAAGAVSDIGEDAAQRLSFIPPKTGSCAASEPFWCSPFWIYNKRKRLKNTFKRQFKEKRQLQSSYAAFTDQMLDYEEVVCRQCIQLALGIVCFHDNLLFIFLLLTQGPAPVLIAAREDKGCM